MIVKDEVFVFESKIPVEIGRRYFSKKCFRIGMHAGRRIGQRREHVLFLYTSEVASLRLPYMESKHLSFEQCLKLT